MEKPQKKQISSQQSTEVDSNKVAELEKIIKEKDEKIQKLQQEIGARDAFLEILDKKVAEMPNKDEKLNVNKVFEKAKDNWLEGFKVAVESTDAGAGILTRPAAGLLAGGAASISSAIHVGVYGLEKSADNVMEVYENTRKGTQEFSELIANNAKDVFKEGMKDATEVTKSVAEGFFSMFNKSETIESLKEKIELLEKLLDEAKKQTEKKDGEIESLRERKDKQIEKLQERIDSLLDNKLTASVEQAPPYNYGNQ